MKIITNAFKKNILFSFILSVIITNSCFCIEKLEKVEIKSNQNGKYISNVYLI
jgi:hypothetical protein